MRRRKRMVRVHFKDHESSVEGVFCGFWSGHYAVRVPKVLETEDRSYSLEGDDVVIPRDRVLFMQRLGDSK